MKISLNWLQTLVDLESLQATAEEIAQALTSVGLAVETIEEGPDGAAVLNLDITSNRPDCLNHLGIARELAAKFRRPLRTPDFAAPESKGTAGIDTASAVTIEAPELCPRYAARIISDVAIGPSPAWLRERLEAIGQRSISNVVDITNFVLFEVGHPLHAFDLHRLGGNRIVVRRAAEGEGIRTLDGIDRPLDTEMLMICDATSPVAVAGIMGGESSEIHNGTTDILLESAYFTPSSIRRTSKRLGLSTEASYRFERGADPEMPVKALNLACRLIEEIAGGRCRGAVIDVNPTVFRRRQVRLRRSRVNLLLGFDIAPPAIEAILDGLEFRARALGSDTWEVEIPGSRPDVSLEADLIEELARHYGYDRVPARYPRPTGPGVPLPTDRCDRILAETLTGFGFSQALNYSFSTPDKEARALGMQSPMVEIANPLTEVDTHLRTSLLPGLLESLRHNLNQGERDIRLFEIGRTYHPVTEEGCFPVTERNVLALIATGDFHRPYWGQAPEEFGFFHLKGIIESLADKLAFACNLAADNQNAFFHPGVAAGLFDEEGPLGCLGELHPSLREEYKLPNRVVYAELKLDRLYAMPRPEAKFTAPGRFPSVERDVSFILDKTIPFSTIEKAVQALAIPELVRFRLIDLYRGQSLPQDKVSLSVRLTFEAPDRTLTHSEVDDRVGLFVAALKEQFAIEQR